MSYPSSLDSFTTHSNGDTLQTTDVNSLNTAVTALETKLGIDSSAVTTTLDYLVKSSSSSDPGHKHTEGALTLSDITTANVSSTKHGLAPKSPADATQFLNGAATPAFAQVKDSDLSTSDVTTNNFTTSKHGFVPKGTNVGSFLKDDGTWSTPTLTVIPTVKSPTSFETAGRFTSTLTGSGTSTFNTVGLRLDTGGTTSDSSKVTWNPVNGSNIFLGSPIFTTRLFTNLVGNDFHMYCGLGALTVAGSGITFTGSHIGFKVTRSGGGTISVYATQADGSTETVSSALTTIVSGDEVDLIAKVNSNTSVDYYWKKNAGALSSATNLTTNIPSASTQSACFAISNAGGSGTSDVFFGSASYER